jgi:importin subunit alpha-1
MLRLPTIPQPNLRGPINIEEIRKLLTSDNEEEVFTGAIDLRKIVSYDVKNMEPVIQVLNNGLVPIVLRQLQKYKRVHDIAFNLLWIINNVAGGPTECTRTVVNEHGIEIVLEFIKKEEDFAWDIIELACWILGNIGGEVQFRNLLLEENVFEIMLEQLATPTNLANIKIFRKSVWTISNLCRGKPRPPWEKIQKAPACLAITVNCSDEEMLIDSLWSISYLSDSGAKEIDLLTSTGMCPRLIELISTVDGSKDIITPTIRCIGNLITSADNITQLLIENGLIRPLSLLLDHSSTAIVKESAWTISNIAASVYPTHIQAILDSDIFPKIAKLINTAEKETLKEIIWIYSNAFNGGTHQQQRDLILLGGLEILITFLQEHLNNEPSFQLVNTIFDAIEIVIKLGKHDQKKNNLKENEMIKLLQDLGGIQLLRNYATSEQDTMYKHIALRIITTYFDGKKDNDDDDDNIDHRPLTPEIRLNDVEIPPFETVHDQCQDDENFIQQLEQIKSNLDALKILDYGVIAQAKVARVIA